MPHRNDSIKTRARPSLLLVKIEASARVNSHPGSAIKPRWRTSLAKPAAAAACLTLAAKISEALASGSELQDRTAGLKRMLEARHSVKSHVVAFKQAVQFGEPADTRSANDFPPARGFRTDQ